MWSDVIKYRKSSTASHGIKHGLQMFPTWCVQKVCHQLWQCHSFIRLDEIRGPTSEDHHISSLPLKLQLITQAYNSSITQVLPIKSSCRGEFFFPSAFLWTLLVVKCCFIIGLQKDSTKNAGFDSFLAINNSTHELVKKQTSWPFRHRAAQELLTVSLHSSQTNQSCLGQSQQYS